MSNPTTCTIVTGADGTRCGAPAVTTFVSKRTGDTFAECEAHAVIAATPEPVLATTFLADGSVCPPTRTKQPFVLVRRGRIVGYAAARTDAVERRAQRLGAVIVPVQR